MIKYISSLYNFVTKNWRRFNFESLKFYIIGFAFGAISVYINNTRYYWFEILCGGLLFSVFFLSIEAFKRYITTYPTKSTNNFSQSQEPKEEKQLINILSTLTKEFKDKPEEDIESASPNIKKHMPNVEENNGRKNDDSPSDKE